MAAPDGYRSYGPEMPAVFLCGTWDDVEFFLAFGAHPLVDVWEVKIEGLVLEDGPDGWLLCRSAIRGPRSGSCARMCPRPSGGVGLGQCAGV